METLVTMRVGRLGSGCKVTVGLCTILSMLSGAVHAGVLVQGNGFQLTDQDVRSEMQFQPEQTRRRLTQDPDALKALIDDLYRRQALAYVGESLRLSDAERFRLERARVEALVEVAVDRVAAELLAKAPNFEERAAELYAAHADRFVTREAVRVRHILFRFEAPDGKDRQRVEAQNALAALRSGAPFEDFAASRSDDSATRSSGGDLGWIERGQTVPEFERAAFALVSTGDLSEVVETKYGLHVLQLQDRRLPATKPFPQVKGQLIASARAEYLKNELAKWKNDVTDSAKATVNVSALNEFIAATLNSGLSQPAAPEGDDQLLGEE